MDTTLENYTANAESFAQRWLNRGDEKSDTATFWLELLHDVLGVEKPGEFIEFEKRVELSHVSFIDAYMPSTKILIEQKSIDIDLTAPAKQSDGSAMTPYEQAKRYKDWLPSSEQGRFIITCNFQTFRIHDLEYPRDEPEIIQLSDLPKEIERLKFLVSVTAKTPREIRELVLSESAGKLIRKFYEAVKPRYKDPDSKHSKESLNMLCTRLVFLLYAEDSGIFPKSSFHDYLSARKKSARDSLLQLFAVLNQNENERDPYIDDDLAAFRYINGGLFKGGIEIPKLDSPDDEPLRIILEDMSEGFDWSGINPPIFGAIFESTLNDDTRTEGGMHYTSIENIHRVIDPLFMNELEEKFKALKPGQKVTALKGKPKREDALRNLQEELASLNFLDPACGSGNFLTESYMSLRRLENKIIAELSQGQINIAEGSLTPVRVSIGQFYGIEINDFAVAVAKTALWIAEHQMMKEAMRIVDIKDDYLPLKTYNRIIQENALTTDWASLIPPERLNYIISNPPFRGARIMTKQQKNELNEIFAGIKGTGNLDYVSCWYRKAHQYMKGTSIRSALVSTNSIAHGDNCPVLWKTLFSEGLSINFAYSPFIWESKAEDKAHVTCVIVGFMEGTPEERHIYTVNDDGRVSGRKAENINGYLCDAPDVFIENRKEPLFDVPRMKIGNQPIDDGKYIFTPDEYQEFIKKEPASKKYFHLWLGGQEFLYNTPRYCLYLADCTPHELKMMPECYKRVEAVRAFRLKSKREATVRLADTPARFQVTTLPKGKYIAVPQTSSEKREYIPMGFMDESVMCGHALQLLPDATLYHFGVLTSLPHMGWVRRITGRLEMRYRYSVSIDYNNFVWPDATEKQRMKIESTAQGILDARAMYPDSSLAELYDPIAMPMELRQAHRENDRAVCAAYGFGKDMDEDSIVNELMRRYQEMTQGE